jgi:phenylacetate-CoA ligase
MTDETMGRYIQHIRGIGPCYLHVYPSSVAKLARFLRRTGIRAPDNIRGILAESENVYPEQRRLVEEVFGGRRYFSSYGHTEKLVAAAECEESTHYHVWPTYGYCELVDDRGRTITTPGQHGEIVGTGFINHVVPFIRYRTGDYATLVGTGCPECGRQHTMLANLQGHKVREYLVASDGTLLPWINMNSQDESYDGVAQFQFFQDTPGRAVLRIVPVDPRQGVDREMVHRTLAQRFEGRLAFSIEIVGAIPLSPSSKTIYVDQRIPDVEAVGENALGVS